ncbi:MAG: hypothetical protein JWR68_838 [Polaromonas sp.]|nr:hypothetical protein [Polaromonas sp.]
MSIDSRNIIKHTVIDDLLIKLSDISCNPDNLSSTELKARRLSLIRLNKQIHKKLAETSTKVRISYDNTDIENYIDQILSDGFNLKKTEPSDHQEFIDAQKLTLWTASISDRVEASEFGSKRFKIDSLRLQRSAIASAKTLHELRQAVKQMISPLQLYREYLILKQATSSAQLMEDNEAAMTELERVLLELEAEQKVSKERKRILDSILCVYQEHDEELVLLRNCESAKKQHNLSDTQAAEMFGISRKKLLVLRKDITFNEPANTSLENICQEFHYIDMEEPIVEECRHEVCA